ncbi:MAG: hypothetical protein M3N13_00660 [Candidatus Eremiobacteraeota bacterium]|nr:hypothetical protein [Candidatus Eremiobacteraeota bacterium]
MRAVYSALGTAVGIAILTACTGGQSAIAPPSTAVNVQSTTALQFRVGTARLATGAVGLNTVVTYRQANGLSGTLYNEPTITLPPGPTPPNNTFTAGNVDVGTNMITSTPPTQPGTTATNTTFGQAGGAFAYGFAPANSNTSGSANYAQFVVAGANTAIYRDSDSSIIVGPGAGNSQNNIEPAVFGQPGVGAIANAYASPFYVSSRNRVPYLLGPPAVPDFHNGTFPPGFLGYDSGFTAFALSAAPVAGTYSLTVVVPSANIGQNAATFTQSATLASVAALPAVAPPTFTPVGVNAAGAGGGSFVVAPAPAGVTNQLLYVVDVAAANARPTMYTFSVPATGGTFVLGPTSGPTLPSGTGGPPFAAGDSVVAYVVGSDYNILAAAVPLNLSQTPALPAQADITVSLLNEYVY